MIEKWMYMVRITHLLTHTYSLTHSLTHLRRLESSSSSRIGTKPTDSRVNSAQSNDGEDANYKQVAESTVA